MVERIELLGFCCLASVALVTACEGREPRRASPAGGDIERATGVGTVRTAVIGSTTPTLERPDVGKIAALGAAPSCTGTLIHPSFVLTAGTCIGSQRIDEASDLITFTKSDGTPIGPVLMNLHWMRYAYPPFASYGWSATLTKDLFLGHLATPVTAIAPATINPVVPPNGSGAFVFGYGRFGATDCTNAADGLKRSVGYAWGSPLPTCAADIGGPTFIDSPMGSLVAVTSGGGELASPVHFHEQLYDEMKTMTNFFAGTKNDWVPFTQRFGPTLSTSTASSAMDCEQQCLAADACRAWNLNGTSCALRTAVGRWSSTNAANTASGVRPFKDQDHTRSGATPLGNAIAALSAAACAAQCGRNSSCKAYGFAPANPPCTLFSTVGTRAVAAGVTSGIKQGPLAGTDLVQGDILPITTAASAEECATKCAKSAECTRYAWDSSGTQACRLKFGASVPSSVSTRTSGIKRAPVLPNVDLIGTPLSTQETNYVLSSGLEEQCRADCELEPLCVAYRAKLPQFGDALRCTLFASVTIEDPVGLAFYTSGYKGLTFF